MGKDKESKKNENEIDAYEYAEEFEKLSLEIVLYKECINSNAIIDKDITQQTRDKGVDAYIVLNINGIYSNYTIEAKLRTGNTLSLKDFATSILYCLINTSHKHFVVTNVSFSPESVKYITELNSLKLKKIELLDCEILKNIINENITHFQNYSSELINYILQKKSFRKLVVSNGNTYSFSQSEELKINFFNKYITKMDEYLKYGYTFFWVSGKQGVGKHTLIDMFCNQKLVQDNYYNYTLDLRIIKTPKLLIIEILRLILGINIDELFGELMRAEGNLNTFFSKFQLFSGCNPDIMKALQYLLDCKDYNVDEYIFCLKILIQHLYQNFFILGKTIITIENLHHVDNRMIKFVFDVIYCLCSENVIFILDILIPQNSTQLPFLSQEQWRGYLQILENFHTKTIHSKNIEVQDMSYDEIVELVDIYLSGPILTTDYYDTFIEHFGTNYLTVINYLEIIKSKKLYTKHFLNALLATPDTFQKNVENLLRDDCYGNFYRDFFTFSYLLDGRLDEQIFTFLSEKYQFQCKFLLAEKEILYRISGHLLMSRIYLNAVQNLYPFIDDSVKKECANWLIDNLKTLDIYENEREYFQVICKYVLDKKQALNEMNRVINTLRINGLFAYVIKLAELRYLYYRETDKKILYYKSIIKYLYHLFKHQAENLVATSRLLKEANHVKRYLAIEYSQNTEYIITNLQLAMLSYYIAKNQYDYETCEKNIDYILSYENQIDKQEIFALAGIYKALIYKEKGDRNSFIIQLIKTLKKYPDFKDVKVSYYANLAAMYKFHNIAISIRLLNLVQEITYNPTTGHGDLWCKIDLLNYKAYFNKLEPSQIEQIRAQVEQKNSLNNLARTFNIEGYYNFSKSNIQLAKECLQTAIFHCLGSGESKQYFLFLLNLINISIVLKENYDNEFYRAYDWFKRHEQQLLNRLHNNPYRKNDHMYTALISLLYIIKTKKQDSLFQKIIANTDIFQDIERLSCMQLLDLVPSFYIIHKMIFILF